MPQENNSKSIERVGKRKWGYSVEQVDNFLSQAQSLYEGDGQIEQGDIQNVSFDLARGGYKISQVDSTLARLERAVVDKRTEKEITEQGRVAWKASTEALYRSILKHVEREDRARFADGAAKAPSYDKKQVDRLLDQIVDKAAANLGVDGVTQDDVRKLANLTSSSVSSAVFTQRRGKKGYDERQVDNFLNSCVQLLSRIESYDRMSKRLGLDESAEDQPSAVNITWGQYGEDSAAEHSSSTETTAVTDVEDAPTWAVADAPTSAEPDAALAEPVSAVVNSEPETGKSAASSGWVGWEDLEGDAESVKPTEVAESTESAGLAGLVQKTNSAEEAADTAEAAAVAEETAVDQPVAVETHTFSVPDLPELPDMPTLNVPDLNAPKSNEG